METKNSFKKNGAVAYMRTSSATNVGGDKDSEKRQREAIENFAERAGIEIVDWYYDEAVSGADLIEERPGFSALLDRIDLNGVRTIVIEDPTRFARSLRASVLGEMLLNAREVTVLCSNGEQLFDHEDEMRAAMSQIAMVFSELEKKRLVRKLKGARDRKAAETGKPCGGRPQVPEEVVAEARRLYRRSPKTGQRRSLRQIAAELERRGHVQRASGRAYNPNSVKQMLQRDR